MSQFDPQAFADLLQKAIGERQSKEFALEAGISRYHVSRLLNAKLETPPRIATLKSIASVAANGVTIQDLYHVCGYAESVSASGIPDQANGTLNSQKAAKASVLTSLNDHGISFELKGGEPQTSCDFELVLGDTHAITWDLLYLTVEQEPEQLKNRIDTVYRLLMYQRLASTYKLSFITDSQYVYQTCIDKRPVNLDANISVLLFSKQTLSILSEQELSKSISAPIPSGVCTFDPDNAML